MYVKQSDCIFSCALLSIFFHCISSAVYYTFSGCDEGLLLPAPLILIFSKMNSLILLASSLQGSPVSRSFVCMLSVQVCKGLGSCFLMFIS